MDNAYELLSSIDRSKLKLAIYSNGDERLHQVLDDLQIASFFDLILTSAETGLEKPRPEAFVRMMKIAKIRDPTEVMHIGDHHEKDYLASKRLNINGILLADKCPTGVPKHEHASDLYEVQNILHSLNLSY